MRGEVNPVLRDLGQTVRSGSKCEGPGSSIAELLMPIGWAALWGEVEQVPERLDSADVARFLPVIGGCVKEFRAPEVTDRVPGAVKHVQHWLLRAVGRLGQVVAVVGVISRGQQAQSRVLSRKSGCARAALSR